MLCRRLASLFAWHSFNLVHLAMKDDRFLRQHGAKDIMEAGLRQRAGIILHGYLSLAFYLGFKGCEAELVRRWRSGEPER